MVNRGLQDLIAATPFIDIHEHLVEERTRLAGAGANRLQPCMDAALLFAHYSKDDLWCAGMTAEERDQFFSASVDPADKWRLVEPAWRRARHTGYQRAIAESVRRLFGVDELNAMTFNTVTEAMQRQVAPGFYRQVLREYAGVEACQVNSLEDDLVCNTQYPDIMPQDMSIMRLSTAMSPATMRDFGARSGLPIATLADWHAVIEWAFATYGGSVVAVKSWAAGGRRLNYDRVSAEEAAPLYARLVQGETLEAAAKKALQDHLMRRCLDHAGKAGLPVKFHCGGQAGNDRMPLEWIRQHAGDLCPLLADFPSVTFVLMHMGYPYQDEFIALAKHYRNVVVEMSWAWIVAPVTGVRFVKEFLMAAPSHKLLPFGGDYATVENIVGHAAIARQGLTQALSELVADDWLTERDALGLVEPLLRGNARALFPTPTAMP
jgi:hypothetical protein